MALSTGDHFGRYEILGILGAGGMGEVYRARDTELDREVAIKVLLEEVAQDADGNASFRDPTTGAMIRDRIVPLLGLKEGALEPR